MTVSATPENMKRYYGRPDLGTVFAWSPATREEFSANPSDYWDRRPDVPLLDSEGAEMVLVTRVSQILDVDMLAS